MAASDAKGQLIDLWRVLGLKPAGDDSRTQHEALAATKEWIRHGVTDPETVIRAVQVLLIDPERTGWQSRDCWTAFRSGLSETWNNAGVEDDHIRYSQALLLMAWPAIKAEGWLANASLMESAWQVSCGTETYRSVVDKWRRTLAADASPSSKTSEQLRETERSRPDLKFGFSADYDTWDNHLKNNLATGWSFNSFAPQLTSMLGDLKRGIDKLGEGLARLAEQLSKQEEVISASVHRRGDNDLLWWGQARYCRPLRQSYRRMDPNDVLWWAAREAAQLSTSLDVEPAAAYLVETLHALGHDITKEKKPLRVWMNELHAALRRADSTAPRISTQLARIADVDALGLPVTWVRLQAASGAELGDATEAVWLNLDVEIDRGDWASWIFRETLLDLRLGQGE